MASAIEVLTHRLTALAIMLSLVGGALAAMDSRHASAMDVQQLTEMIQDDRIEELEYKIEDTEDQINRIQSVPEEDRYDGEDQYLHDLENKKERYIRKLERLNNE
jgi:hypothetical protein